MNALTRMAAPSALLAITGCAVAPLDHAAQSARDRVIERAAVGPEWPPAAGDPGAAPEIQEPLTLPAALTLAFTRNPNVRRQYARLGIAHADLQDAARIANPRLSLAWLSPAGGGRDQTTKGISASFADLLLLPSRRRLSASEFRRVELAVAAGLVALTREVETAWYQQVGALQVATLRDAVARAAETEATLANRYHEAGNISQLQLDLQQAAMARAAIDALRARSDASKARARLADLLGLRTDAPWQTVERLPAPPSTPLSQQELVERAQAQRLDLTAAREEVALLEDALGVTRNWRLLGSVGVGYERERETDGTKLIGPTLELELPLFDQGQGAVSRAQARLLDARARRDGLALTVENEVAAGYERLALALDASVRYRDGLVPSSASAVGRLQEEVNFMLESVFELMRAKRDEYDAWQGYLDSVRDYWIARSGLRAATGGRLPGDDDEYALSIGPEDIALPQSKPTAGESNAHQHQGDAP